MVDPQQLELQFNGTRADDLQVGGTHYKQMPIEPWEVMDAVLTTEPLRYPEEFVRHKILDIIGDLALLGRLLKG